MGDGALTPPISPNKAWCEEHEGKALRLEWPDETYVVLVQRVSESDDDDG